MNATTLRRNADAARLGAAAAYTRGDQKAGDDLRARARALAIEADALFCESEAAEAAAEAARLAAYASSARRAAADLRAIL